jgi:hypothetical protein
MHFGEATGDKANPYANAQDLKTGDDGTVTFKVANHQAASISVSERGPEGSRGFAMDRAKQRECVFRVLDEAGFEGAIKDDYDGFLTSTCLDKDTRASVRKIGFDFSGGGKPLYDPNSGKIQGVGIGEDYDELIRGMIHEMSHGLIAVAIDPGKDVGGGHNNWEPIDPAKVKAGTPEELAFEEGIADFIAMLYFKQRGEVYQSDLGDATITGKAIEANGRDKSARTESVITSYLWDLYRPVIESGPAGAQMALADFLQTLTYERRQATFGSWSTKPARTIHDFISARIKRSADAAEQKQCYGAIEAQKVRDIANAYGFTEPPKVQAGPEGERILQAGVHDLPPGSDATFQNGATYLDDGRISKATVRGGGQIEIEGDGGMTLRRGTAVVTDGPARTVELNMVPMGTAYLVTVEGDRSTVAVAKGSVEVVERGGAGRKITLAAGQAADYTAKAGFAAPRDAAKDLARAAPPTPKAPGTQAAGSVPWPAIIGCGAALLLVLVLAIRSRSRSK